MAGNTSPKPAPALAFALTIALLAVLAASARAGEPTRPQDGRIVFTTGGEHVHALVSAPLGSGDQRVLVRGLIDSPTPARSPDGTLIAFVRGRSIWLSRADGSAQRRLVVGSHPSWSPDGRRVTFLGLAGVMTIRRDGSGLQEVVHAENPWAQTPNWSPDGDWIACLIGDDQLWVVRPDGTGLHRVATAVESSAPTGDGANFSWSPDGRRLAYVARGNGTAIFTVSVEGGGAARLTDDPVEEGAPQWSPDGTRIAFWREGEGTAVVRADGSGPAQHVTRGTAPSWSPDSRRLAVVRGAHVWVASADGRSVRRVSRRQGTRAAVTSRPVWTPNGRRILFSRESSFPSELVTVLPTGGERRRLTHNRLREIEPAWSPDGRMIAFTGVFDEERAAEKEIYVMRADGTHLRRLTRRRGPDSQPAWSPDGKRIVFVRASGSGAVLHVMSVIGGRSRPIRHLEPGIRAAGHPAWAPARWIAFDGLDLVSATGKSGGRLTRPREEAPDTQPDWAPDGRRFAFVRSVSMPCRQCEWLELYVGRLGTRRVRRVAANLVAPSWSPGGSRIAAVTEGGGALVTIKPDGSDRRVLAVGVEDEAGLDWGPAR